MPSYIILELDSEPSDLLQEVYDYLQSNIPGWEPAEGNLDVWLAEAFAQIASDNRIMASQVPVEIFRYFGSSIVNLPPLEAFAGSTTTTWTMKDNAGYTIPDGTQVGIRNANGDLIAFETMGDYVVPAGATATATGEVPIIGVVPGADTSGLGSVGGEVELIDPLEFVTSIVMTALTSGGTDAEPDQEYLDRLRTRMQLMTGRPVLPRDFAILARDIAGVHRSVAIDGFIPPASTGQERAVAVVAIDSSGAAVSAPVKAAVDAYLQSLREVNFIVNVIDPAYSQIDVTVTVKARVEYENVAADIADALAAYFSPATWGVPADESPEDWDLVTNVRYLEIVQVINSVPGVDYITSTAPGTFDLTTAIHGNALARQDIVMPGTAPLPLPGVFTVTVT